MKRVLFWVVGFMIVVAGLLLEGALIAGIFAAFINTWSVVVIAVVGFSIIIGDRIYRYGFKENYRMYEDNNNDISL